MSPANFDHRVFPRVLDVALRALPEIVHVGGKADEAVGEVGLLSLQPLDLGGGIEGAWIGLLAVSRPRAPGRLKDRVGGLLQRRGIGGLLLRVVFAHRRSLEWFAADIEARAAKIKPTDERGKLFPLPGIML